MWGNRFVLLPGPHHCPRQQPEHPVHGRREHHPHKFVIFARVFAVCTHWRPGYRVLLRLAIGEDFHTVRAYVVALFHCEYIHYAANKIENCIISTLKEYNIDSFADKKNIGIWVGKKNNPKKVAAIGVRVKKWIAYHGFALNITVDLKKYDSIKPCGITDKKITNLSKLSKKSYKNINKVIISKFLSAFL